MFTEYNTKYFLILQAQEILSGNYVLILCVREKLTIFISDGIHVVVVENRIFFIKMFKTWYIILSRMWKRNILVTATRLNGKNKDIILSFLFCSKAYEIMKTNNARRKLFIFKLDVK